MSMHIRVSDRIRVPLPVEQAFALFTARGEQAWADGWQPHFPAPTPDDSAPGTVFETHAHGGHTIWVVTDSRPPNYISYARITPGERAGTVSVTLRPLGQHSEVEVSYDLTALQPAATTELDRFAEDYPAYLRSWQEAIEAQLAGGAPAAG